jgi:N-acetylglucosaminyl-diphospho-decaprenol L-rhamnosyltransferase
VTALVDVVVVAYRSGETLRGCIEPLAALPWVHATVVDNACPDASADVIADLDVELVRAPRNGGFAYGCNLGAARGTAPYVMFLNPDARIGTESIEAMLAALRDDPSAGLVGPRILDDDGSLEWSLRRYPRLRSTYAQALFLHRVWRQADWVDELIRDEAAYYRPGTPDWLSGACMLVRRDVFDAIGGWDEGFFLYCEDIDICRRVWLSGHSVRFEPRAEVQHVGGASSEVGETRAIAARSRVIYAHKHRDRRTARLETFGVALGEATHALTAVGRPAARRGHTAALRAVVGLA